MTKLAVIGAGPKGIAIGAKAKVLKALGLGSVDVVMFDGRSTAAHWTGKAGYTDGVQILGTPPDKDIAFPHRSIYGKDADRRMMEASWASYRIFACGDYAEWIDRGRPAPTHSEFAAYLRWVSTTLDLSLVSAEVTAVYPVQPDSFRLTYRKIGSTDVHGELFDGVVLTGPGDPIRLDVQDHDPHVMDGKTYWMQVRQFHGLPKGTKVAVIGGGETAASTLLSLIKVAPDADVQLISRHSMFSRGEGHTENSMFTSPDEWLGMEVDERIDFIRHTDRGVFSLDAVGRLRDKIFGMLQGNVTAIRRDGDSIAVTLQRPIHNNSTITRHFDYVIVALGFDPAGTLKKLLGAFAPDDWVVTMRKCGDIDEHLRLRLSEKNPQLQGWTDYVNIHVPMLAGLAQGPGFPNLSCLGLLSDRVLSRYIKPSAASREAVASGEGDRI